MGRDDKGTRRRRFTPFSTPWSALPSLFVGRLRARSLPTHDTFLYFTLILRPAKTMELISRVTTRND